MSLYLPPQIPNALLSFRGEIELDCPNYRGMLHVIPMQSVDGLIDQVQELKTKPYAWSGDCPAMSDWTGRNFFDRGHRRAVEELPGCENRQKHEAICILESLQAICARLQKDQIRERLSIYKKSIGFNWGSRKTVGLPLQQSCDQGSSRVGKLTCEGMREADRLLAILVLLRTPFRSLHRKRGFSRLFRRAQCDSELAVCGDESGDNRCKRGACRCPAGCLSRPEGWHSKHQDNHRRTHAHRSDCPAQRVRPYHPRYVHLALPDMEPILP